MFFGVVVILELIVYVLFVFFQCLDTHFVLTRNIKSETICLSNLCDLYYRLKNEKEKENVDVACELRNIFSDYKDSYDMYVFLIFQVNLCKECFLEGNWFLKYLKGKVFLNKEQFDNFKNDFDNLIKICKSDNNIQKKTIEYLNLAKHSIVPRIKVILLIYKAYFLILKITKKDASCVVEISRKFMLFLSCLKNAGKELGVKI